MDKTEQTTRPKLSLKQQTAWLEASVRRAAARYAKRAGDDEETLVQAVHDDLIASIDYSDRMAEATKAVGFDKAWVGKVIGTAQKDGSLAKLATVLGWVGEAVQAEARAALPAILEAAKGQKPTLGSGERFAKLSKQVGSPALAAWIGRKKHGKKRMAELSTKGRRAAKRMGEGEEDVAAVTAQRIEDYFTDSAKRKLPGPLIGYLIRIGSVKRGAA
jgi:hypothetical protein